MDANDVIGDLLHNDIISLATHEKISLCNCPKQRSGILHKHLIHTSTDESFIKACDIIIKVKGNPKMTDLGKHMKKKLETGT